MLELIITFLPVHQQNFSLGISHVLLTMSPDDDLLVYRNRGRPTTEDVERVNCPIARKEDLENIRTKLSFKKGTEIVLAISIASDDMIRHVMMFPEVFYMDVTANTNKQKRDLFLMVVNDANGETFIGNATIIYHLAKDGYIIQSTSTFSCTYTAKRQLNAID